MVKKEITFIYLDAVQKQVYEYIAAEAEARGYKTCITDDRFAKCEIGWYCEHINFPQYSKFSVIMLHDITQQYGNWPDIWMREPWNLYDIGFLPSKVWVNNWNQCSQYYYANPKHGVYLTGWPKADRLSAYTDSVKRREYKKSIGLDINKPTVLYAPAWENDNKQDEFVQAMLKLDVNILIKQAPWPDTYPEQLENIKQMEKLHKNLLHVFILDPKTNILDAIMVSDVLVSEESSTMCEAVMMGKPAVSVCNWLIPDTTPSRYPADNYEYVIRTKKEELTLCIEKILKNYSFYQKNAQLYSNEHFSNIGKCIPIMLDILDSVIEEKEPIVSALNPQPRRLPGLRRVANQKYIRFRRVMALNYCERNVVLKMLRQLYRKLRSHKN